MRVQAIPTHGATGIAHFALTPANSSRSFDYLAVSNYGGTSKIYRWLPGGPVTGVSIGRDARRGRGYVPGVYRLFSKSGAEFLAYSDTDELTMVRDKSPLAGYNFSGGSLVCSPLTPTQCARIVSAGAGFEPDTSLPASVADSQLVGKDYKCLRGGCNPLMKDYNCTLSREPVCNAVKVRGSLDIFYDYGCARDDTACREIRMSESITTMKLLNGNNGQPRGHTSKCRQPGVIFHNNTGDADRHSWMEYRGLRLDKASLRVDYTVNSATGAIVALEFPDAAGHGEGYAKDPQVRLSDGSCRCGTSITSIDLIYGGQGYSSGTMTMSGSPTQQRPASGAGFLAEFLAKGNVTEIRVLASGAGFTSPPSVAIINDELNVKGAKAAGARAVATLRIDRILMLRKGSNYKYAPRVEIEEPQAVGGRRAEAEVILEEDTDPIVSYAKGSSTRGTGYRVAGLRVTDPGFGYTRLPVISFVDHPNESPQRTAPSALAVLAIDTVLVNHDYSRYNVAFRERPDILLQWRNARQWFGGQASPTAPPEQNGTAPLEQNGEYVQTPVDGKLKGVRALTVV